MASIALTRAVLHGPHGVAFSSRIYVVVSSHSAHSAQLQTTGGKQLAQSIKNNFEGV